MSLTALGRYDELEAVLRQNQAQGDESRQWGGQLCNLAAIRGNQAELQRQIDWLKGSKDGRSRINGYLVQGAHAVVSGRLAAADQLMQQVSELFKPDKYFGVNLLTYVNLGAYIAAAVGDCERARTVKTIDTLIMCGSPDEAQARIEKSLAANPERQLVSRVHYPLTMAQIALQRGDYRKALALSDPIVARYKDVRKFDLPKLRGQAYLGLGDGKAAAAEFQQIIDRRGLDVWSIDYPLAYVYLGRAWKMAGDLPKSRKAYEDFFAFWKEADPDIPILKQAREEYAKLQ
jgi:tetratricopeptide (TPR) repeat protein